MLHSDPTHPTQNDAPRLRPPFIAGLTILASLGVDTLLHASRRVPRKPGMLIGGAVASLGIGLAESAVRIFHHQGTTHDPRGYPQALVTSGPFRFTRNPMYVGVTLALLGIGLARGTVAALLSPLAFAAIVHKIQIPTEERRLAAAFGDEYRDYRERVGRWI